MGSTSKKPHIYYHPERRRIKKKNKIPSLVKQHEALEKKRKVEGETKWIKNASQKLGVRIKKAHLKVL